MAQEPGPCQSWAQQQDSGERLGQDAHARTIQGATAKQARRHSATASQFAECSQCGHTHPDNRPSQAVFVCQRCGFRSNADHNASLVIRDRGVALILSGEFSAKGKKKTMRLRTKVGAGCSEPGSEGTSTPGETRVRHRAGNCPAHESSNPETPATSRRL